MSVVKRLRAREFGNMSHSTRHSVHSKPILHSVPDRLFIPLVDIANLEVLQPGHVVLGFSKDGNYLISYTALLGENLTSDVGNVWEEDPFSTDYIYHLYWWRFNLHQRLVKAASCRLFATERISQCLILAVCQGSNKDQVLVVGRPAELSREDTHTSFVTITSCPPSSGYCLACTNTRKDNPKASCVQHSFAVHFKYDTMPPHPPVIQPTTVGIPNVFVINTGTSLEVLDITPKAILPWSTMDSSGLVHKVEGCGGRHDKWNQHPREYSNSVLDDCSDLSDDGVHLYHHEHVKNKEAVGNGEVCSSIDCTVNGCAQPCDHHVYLIDSNSHCCRMAGNILPSSTCQSDVNCVAEQSRHCGSQDSPSLIRANQPVARVCRHYTESPGGFTLAESQDTADYHTVSVGATTPVGYPMYLLDAESVHDIAHLAMPSNCVQVRQMTLDVEEYIHFAVQQSEELNDRFRALIDYELTLVEACGSSGTVTVLVQAQVKAWPTPPQAGGDEDDLQTPSLHSTTFLFSWNVRTGKIETLEIWPLSVLEHGTLARQDVAKCIMERARQWSTSNHTLSAFHGLTNITVFTGQTLSKLTHPTLPAVITLGVSFQ